jgi:hypothetical protein
MRRWPPLVWLLISAGSLLILVGYNGADYNPEAFWPGVAMAVIAFAVSLYLAYGNGGRNAAGGLWWLVPAGAVFYLVAAIAGLAFAGDEYMLAALGAGLIPLTAASLIIATARSKTVHSGDRRVDPTPEDDSPFPGVGMDDETPLGDTPEHSDAERVARPDRRFERRSGSRTRR